MNNVIAKLNALQRPKLLIRAARAGVQNFCFKRDLNKSDDNIEQKNTPKLIDALFIEESRLNKERLQNDTAYNVLKHIRVLTALIATANIPTPKQEAA